MRLTFCAVVLCFACLNRSARSGEVDTRLFELQQFWRCAASLALFNAADWAGVDTIAVVRVLAAPQSGRFEYDTTSEEAVLRYSAEIEVLRTLRGQVNRSAWAVEWVERAKGPFEQHSARELYRDLAFRDACADLRGRSFDQPEIETDTRCLVVSVDESKSGRDGLTVICELNEKTLAADVAHLEQALTKADGANAVGSRSAALERFRSSLRALQFDDCIEQMLNEKDMLLQAACAYLCSPAVLPDDKQAYEHLETLMARLYARIRKGGFNYRQLEGIALGIEARRMASDRQRGLSRDVLVALAELSRDVEPASVRFPIFCATTLRKFDPQDPQFVLLNYRRPDERK